MNFRAFITSKLLNAPISHRIFAEFEKDLDKIAEQKEVLILF